MSATAITPRTAWRSPTKTARLAVVAQPVRLGHDLGWHRHAELGEEHLVPDEHLVAVDLRVIPLPGNARNATASSSGSPRSAAPRTIAIAMWCSESRSALAASRSTAPRSSRSQTRPRRSAPAGRG